MGKLVDFSGLNNETTDLVLNEAKGLLARELCSKYKARILKTFNKYPQDKARKGSLQTSKLEFEGSDEAGRSVIFSDYTLPTLQAELDRVLSLPG